MNQQAFANLTGIATASLSNIYGGRTRPTLNHVEALMKSFPTLNINWLLTGEGEMFGSLSNPDRSAGDEQSGSEDGKPTTDGNDVAVQHTTDKMAEPLLPFADESQNTVIGQNFPTQQSPAGYNSQPRHQSYQPTGHKSSQPSAQQSSMRGGYPSVNVVPSVSPSTRKITEIRVFYDDQTWES